MSLDKISGIINAASPLLGALKSGGGKTEESSEGGGLPNPSNLLKGIKLPELRDPLGILNKGGGSDKKSDQLSSANSFGNILKG